MGGLDAFELIIAGPGIYYSGQTVQGHVIVHASEVLDNIKSVQIKIKGKGELRWTEQVSRTRTNEDGQTETYHETVEYENSEKYFKHKQILHSGDVSEGRNEFPFSIELPPNLPCSFEYRGHVKASIRYQVEAKLDRSGFFTSDKKKKKFVTVNALMDLNQIPSMADPITVSNHKTFGCLCCTSGPLSATVNLPRSGYTGGESIPVTADIENLSNKVMNKSQAKFIQHLVFRARGKSKTVERTLQEIKRGEIQAGESETWDSVMVPVPAVPPTNFGGHCSIMDVDYKLEFHVDPSGIGFDLVNNIPLTIGTIPLRAIFQSWATPPAAEYNPSAPPMPLNDYPDLPPPTYENAISANEDGEQGNVKRQRDEGKDTEANWDYHPTYPMWVSPPPQ